MVELILEEYKKRKGDSKNLIDEFYSHDEDDQTQEESETEEKIKETETEETKNSGDGNNTEEQKKLGIDIKMIGARKEELGRTRSQTKEMVSPRNESMETAELTMEYWIHETTLISAVTSGPMSIPSFFCSSVLLPSPLFLVSSVSVSFNSSVSLSSWVWSLANHSPHLPSLDITS